MKTMRNFFERINRSLKSNKGFSLVELIIVIAIMAVLIAVLAPQYTKYIERSRVQSDINALEEVMSAVKVACIDPDDGVTESGNITIPKAGGAIGSTFTDATIKGDIINALGTDKINLTSKTYKATSGNWTIYVTYSTTTGFKFTADWPNAKFPNT